MAKAAWKHQEWQYHLELPKLCYHPWLAADEGRYRMCFHMLYHEKKKLTLGLNICYSYMHGIIKMLNTILEYVIPCCILISFGMIGSKSTVVDMPKNQTNEVKILSGCCSFIFYQNISVYSIFNLCIVGIHPYKNCKTHFFCYGKIQSFY